MKFGIVTKKLLYCLWIAVIFNVSLNFPVIADTRIAVLDFELRDLTLRPRTQAELERTASIKSLLQTVLEKDGNYSIVQIDAAAHQEANPGFGYLFDNHDIAADLGRTVGADYVIVGRVHKPSFLFAYLMTHLVNVKTQKLVGNYVVEVKGPQKKITTKGVESLARKIYKTLQR